MTYPYEVLKYIDTLNIEIIYVNLIVLDMNDMPIKEING
jgi:hypothetical protein